MPVLDWAEDLVCLRIWLGRAGLQICFIWVGLGSCFGLVRDLVYSRFGWVEHLVGLDLVSLEITFD